MSGSSPMRGRRWPRCSGGLIAAQRAGQAAASVPLGYLARLQRAFGAQPPAPGPGRDTAAVPGIVDPLTGRELEVLRMLAAGRSNQAIARELVVTLDTVKSMWATSWASSARLTAPSPWPGPANLASSPDAPPVPPAGGGQRHQVPRGNRPAGAVRGPLPSCGSFAARSLHPHDGQAQTPGQVTPWCPVPTEDSTRHSPFG